METEKHINELTLKDRELWKIAKKRVGFKKHLGIYIFVNSLLWLLWFLTDKKHDQAASFPWPLWSMFGWGIGLVFSYLDAYVLTKKDAIEKEYNKLKQK